MANCMSCASVLEEAHAYCPRCGTKAIPGRVMRPEPPLAAILMASIGGLIAFLGSFFGLIAAVAEQSFLVLALVACGISLALFVLAYLSRRRQLWEWNERMAKEASMAKCEYCGSQNANGTNKCQSCGAPL